MFNCINLILLISFTDHLNNIFKKNDSMINEYNDMNFKNKLTCCFMLNQNPNLNILNS